MVRTRLGALAVAAGGDTEPEPDVDEDGVPDSEDNHPCIFNDDQAPIANDTVGDSCLRGHWGHWRQRLRDDECSRH